MGRAPGARRLLYGALGAVAALALIGCGRLPGLHAAAVAPPPSTAAPKAAPTDSDADLVSAVASGTTAVPISVKFRIGKRPQLGVPLPILLAIIPAPTAQIGHLHGAFQADSGLTLQGDHAFDASDLRAGEPLERQLTVVPQQPGVLNLNATFTLDLDNGSVSRSFAIPVIVGDNSS